MKEPQPVFWPMLLRLWQGYMRHYFLYFVGALACMVVLSAAMGAIPKTTEWVFSAFDASSSGAHQADPAQVARYAPILFAVIGLILGVAGFAFTALSSRAAICVLRDIQRDMMDSVLRYDLAQSKALGGAQIASRFTNDVGMLQDSIIRLLNALRDTGMLLVHLGLMLHFDWVLFLIIVFVYPLAAIPVVVIGKVLRHMAGRVQGQIGDLLALLTQSINGMHMVKTYRLEEYERGRLAGAFETRRRLTMVAAMIRGANVPLINLVGSVAIAVVIGVAAWRVSLGALEGATLVAFVINLLMVSQPARGLGALNVVLQEATASLARVFQIIDRPPAIVDDFDAQTLDLSVKPGVPMLELRDVFFSYTEGLPTLRNVSIAVERGTTLALVGESGGGKSTILTLLPRLYDRHTGHILVNGQPVDKVTIASLRQAMALVSQDAILFDDTVARNIAFGAGDVDQVSSAAIERAARHAAAHDFITNLPQGYDTKVGEGGGNLSGGQRQRIALARAFLKDAPILLLDEATSALDAESEAQIQQALAHLAKNRTTVVIAHRLSTIRKADVICVMMKGEVVEIGKHEELIAQSGPYARLYALQFEKHT